MALEAKIKEIIDKLLGNYVGFVDTTIEPIKVDDGDDGDGGRHRRHRGSHGMIYKRILYILYLIYLI